MNNEEENAQINAKNVILHFTSKNKHIKKFLLHVLLPYHYLWLYNVTYDLA